MDLETAELPLTEQVDQLEAVVSGSWRVPGTGWVFVDRSMLLEVIDRMRLVLPEQVQAAQRLLERRERVLEATRLEADALLADAQRQAFRGLADEVFDQAALSRAAAIDARARQAAARIERQSEQAAAERLRILRAQLREVERVLAQQLPSPEPADDARAHAQADTSTRRPAPGMQRSRAA
jgi:hypothetical protein